MLLRASTSGVVAGAMPEAAVMPGEIVVGMAIAGASINGGIEVGKIFLAICVTVAKGRCKA